MRRRVANLAVLDLLQALVLALFVGVPFCATFLNRTLPAKSAVEHRTLAPFPGFPHSREGWLSFPKQFDAFARDRFGFRGELLAGYKFLLADVFGQSASDGVIVGRRGWLYTTKDNALEDMRGVDPFRPGEMRDAVQQIVARGDLLTALHVRYVFFVAPDKHTVYPEFLPRGVYAGFVHRRLHAFDLAMSETGRPYYFDLSDTLRADAADSPWPLYYKGDTHWNVWGAYLAYEKLAARFGNDGLHSIGFAFNQFRQPGPPDRRSDGDLARMSGYAPVDPDIWPPLTMPCYPLRDWTMSGPLQQRLGVVPQLLRRTGDCDGGVGTALVIHDSFMDNMAWHVSDNFANTFYVWKYVDDAGFAALIHAVQPHVVLVERVERLMHQFPRTDMRDLVAKLGLVGEPAQLATDGSLVIGPSGHSVARRKVAAGISIDHVGKLAGHWLIEGWANMDNRPPAVIVAVSGGTIVAEAPLAEYRADVARGTRNPLLAWSGFKLQVPGEIDATQLVALRFYALGYDTYGSAPVGDRLQQLLGAVEGKEGNGAR